MLSTLSRRHAEQPPPPPCCSLLPARIDVSQVFGMTASPTVECVEVLRCRAYVCEDDLIEEFQANAQWELLFYPVSFFFNVLAVWRFVFLLYSPVRW